MRQFNGGLCRSCSHYASFCHIVRVELWHQNLRKGFVFSGAYEPPSLIPIISCSSISGAPDTRVTNQQDWIILSRCTRESLSTSQLFCDWSSIVSLSNDPGIETLSKRYPLNVSYPKTWLAYSRLTRRIQPCISSLRNEVQSHLRSTLLSSVTVSDLTPHTYSIQWLISTTQALIIHIWSHSRHASEPWIPTLHYLWICGCQHTECHLVWH